MEHFRGAAFRFVTIIGRYEAQNKQPNFLSALLPHLLQLHLIIASSFDCHQQLLHILWHTLRRLAGTNHATANAFEIITINIIDMQNCHKMSKNIYYTPAHEF